MVDTQIILNVKVKRFKMVKIWNTTAVKWYKFCTSMNNTYLEVCCSRLAAHAPAMLTALFFLMPDDDDVSTGALATCFWMFDLTVFLIMPIWLLSARTSLPPSKSLPSSSKSESLSQASCRLADCSRNSKSSGTSRLRLDLFDSRSLPSETELADDVEGLRLVSKIELFWSEPFATTSSDDCEGNANNRQELVHSSHRSN